MTILERHVDTERDMEAQGAELANAAGRTSLIHLRGALGSGKTTLVRGLIHALGHQGTVKSPTYTLVEPYFLTGTPVYHIDLYRLKNPEELEFLGVREYLAGPGLCLVEWAERGAGILPVPDIDVMIHKVNQGRKVRLVSHTDRGAALLAELDRAQRAPPGVQGT